MQKSSRREEWLAQKGGRSHSEELCDEASMLKQPHCYQHRAGLNMDPFTALRLRMTEKKNCSSG